jgi:hypothetical protein
MIRELDANKPAKLQRVVAAVKSAFSSHRQAEIAFMKAMEEFDLRKKTETVLLGAASWALLFLISWFVCGALHQKVGKGRRPVVLLPALLVFLLVCGFEFLK